MQPLPIDRYGFSIVTSQAELEQANNEGDQNVKVECPECLAQMLRTIGEASKVLQFGCQQHQVEEEEVVHRSGEQVRFNKLKR